jgi:hypothetical protein
MDSRRASLLALLFVLGGLAGCGTVLEATDSFSEPDSLTGSGEHPFAGETVAVAVEGTDRERAIVADGLAYWADNASEYTGFDVAFRVLVPGTTPADGADVRLRFVETVGACGDTELPAGCAPRITASTDRRPSRYVAGWPTSRRGWSSATRPATCWGSGTPTDRAT